MASLPSRHAPNLCPEYPVQPSDDKVVAVGAGDGVGDGGVVPGIGVHRGHGHDDAVGRPVLGDVAVRGRSKLGRRVVDILDWLILFVDIFYKNR